MSVHACLVVNNACVIWQFVKACTVDGNGHGQITNMTYDPGSRYLSFRLPFYSPRHISKHDKSELGLHSMVKELYYGYLDRYYDCNMIHDLWE